MSKASPDSILKEGLKGLSISLTDDQGRSFMTYLAELKKWSRTYNLTGLKTDEEIIVKHFLDSLLYLQALPDGVISVMDVGSGAGFPGIPIKIVRPKIDLILVEPSRKKVNFLKHISRKLGLEKIEVMEKRVEELGSLSVDVALTRALFSIKDFYRKVSPLVRDGGMLVLNKGPKVHEELRGVRGMEYDILTLKLPCSDSMRFLVVIKKKESPEGSERGRTTIANMDNAAKNICFNSECRLRKAGCRGFEGCPGFKGKA